MATQALNNLEVESTAVVRLGDVLPASLLDVYRDAVPAFVKGSERASDGSAGDGNSFNGAIVAIALEAAAAFAVFAVWQIWHLLG